MEESKRKRIKKIKQTEKKLDYKNNQWYQVAGNWKTENSGASEGC